MNGKEFDLVVWGATGFTGQLVVEYLHGTYGAAGDLTWAVAGRNPDKLAEIKARILGNDADRVPEIIADKDNEASLRDLVSRTRVVCTTVGPYALYGTPLVKLCAESGTHYCDLTGELHWMRKVIDHYHPLAEKSGARIVHSCGFDSIPSDLGTLYLQQQMKNRTGEYASRVKYRVSTLGGGVSGGTVASGLNIHEEARGNPGILELMEDPYALNPADMPRGEDGPDQTFAEYDQDFRQWTGPFVMAGINTRVVRRSHALLGYPWGSGFRYDEAVLTGNGPAGFAKAGLMAGTIGLFSTLVAYGPTRGLLRRLLPSPGEGPSEETMKKAAFEVVLFGAHSEDPGKSLIAVVTGDRDPGYGATSRMLAESAVCLAKDDLASAGGVLTPACAMGDLLIQRLNEKAGMSFRIRS